jgi:hypothetical protein
MKWQSAAKKYVDLPVRAFDRQRRELPLTTVEIAAVQPGVGVNAGTPWQVVQVSDKKATIYVLGSNAGVVPTGVTAPVISVPPTGVDLWIRPTDAMESDPVYVDRITLV